MISRLRIAYDWQFLVFLKILILYFQPTRGFSTGGRFLFFFFLMHVNATLGNGMNYLADSIYEEKKIYIHIPASLKKKKHILI